MGGATSTQKAKLREVNKGEDVAALAQQAPLPQASAP